MGEDDFLEAQYEERFEADTDGDIYDADLFGDEPNFEELTDEYDA